MRLTNNISGAGDIRPLHVGHFPCSRRREEADRSTGVIGESASSPRRLRLQAAFTLVEIALCIAIIGFALVAIIGVLPAGLNVQRENREETIIVQEANYFMDAIRNGARGLNDLTNYVESITNIRTLYLPDNVTIAPNYPQVRAYTYTDVRINGAQGNLADVLTNGAHIIGLMSTPKYEYFYPDPSVAIHQGFASNYVIAYVRALSGSAVEKPPQSSATVVDLSFRYRMICELNPYSGWNSNWVNFNATGLTLDEYFTRSNTWRMARMRQANMHELRLLFRWPIKAGGEPGNERQTFRTLATGAMLLTNEPTDGSRVLWFMQPGTYQTPL